MTDLAHWTSRERPQKRPPEGRSWRPDPLIPPRHGDDLFAACSGPGAEDLFRYLFETPPADRADFEPWLAKAAASEDPMFFAVVDQKTGRAVGRLTFMRIDQTHGVIETGSI